MEIKIDRGVKKSSAIRGRKTKYPWDEMKVGDSFALASQKHALAYTLASNASYRLAPKKFSGGKDEKGIYRIWRDA